MERVQTKAQNDETRTLNCADTVCDDTEKLIRNPRNQEHESSNIPGFLGSLLIAAAHRGNETDMNALKLKSPTLHFEIGNPHTPPA